MAAGTIGQGSLLPWWCRGRSGRPSLLPRMKCGRRSGPQRVTHSLRDMNRQFVTGFARWPSHGRAIAVTVRIRKGYRMITNEVSDGLAGILRTAIVELVRRDGPDLSARQLGVFLTCYLETDAQTVRGLAAKLGVSKPAITRALDRLSEFDLVRRKTDPLDRRSVLVQRTATGMAFLRELRTILRDAAASMRITAEPTPARHRSGSEVRAAH
jgi:DNA-binding MarR family transcriptional regulator